MSDTESESESDYEFEDRITAKDMYDEIIKYADENGKVSLKNIEKGLEDISRKITSSRLINLYLPPHGYLSKIIIPRN